MKLEDGMNEPDFDFEIDEPTFEIDTGQFDKNVKQFRKRSKEMQERGGELKKGLELGFINGQQTISALKEDWKKWILFLGILLFALVLYKLTRA